VRYCYVVGLCEILLCSPRASSPALCMVPVSFLVCFIRRLCVVFLPLFVSGRRAWIGFLLCVVCFGLFVKDGALSTVWVSISPVFSIAVLGYGEVPVCLVTV
jgi:hypothetical protein